MIFRKALSNGNKYVNYMLPLQQTTAVVVNMMIKN